jgi:hypothetical protein
MNKVKKNSESNARKFKKGLSQANPVLEELILEEKKLSNEFCPITKAI